MIKYSRHAMWVSDGVVGRTEKRLQASSGLDLSHAVAYVGEWDREADSILMLADEANVHNNHVNDPTSDTMNMSQSAGFNMVRPRSTSDTMNIIDHVHVCLCGYTPGGGDTYLDRHSLTANETIAIAQPVYISGNNTVNLADADSINTSRVLGLAETAGTANNTMNVLSSGTVTKADWTSVAGSATLTPGAIYYLSTTAGQLTTTPPSGDGDVVVSCGLALTTTKLDIEISEGVVL